MGYINTFKGMPPNDICPYRCNANNNAVPDEKNSKKKFTNLEAAINDACRAVL